MLYHTLLYLCFAVLWSTTTMIYPAVIIRSIMLFFANARLYLWCDYPAVYHKMLFLYYTTLHLRQALLCCYNAILYNARPHYIILVLHYPTPAILVTVLHIAILILCCSTRVSYFTYVIIDDTWTTLHYTLHHRLSALYFHLAMYVPICIMLIALHQTILRYTLLYLQYPMLVLLYCTLVQNIGKSS